MQNKLCIAAMPHIGRERAYEALKTAVLYDIELRDEMVIDDMFKEAANYAATELLWDPEEKGDIEDKLILNDSFVKILVTEGIPVLLEEEGGYTSLNMTYYESDESEDNTQLDNMIAGALSLVLYNFTRSYGTNKSLLTEFIHKQYYVAKLEDEKVCAEYPKTEIDELVDSLKGNFHVNASDFMERCAKIFTKKKNKVVTLSIVVAEDVGTAEIKESLSSLDWIDGVCIKDEATIPATTAETDKKERKENIFNSQDIVNASL